MTLYQKFHQELPEARQMQHVLQATPRRPLSSARQRAEANIEKVMSQIRNGSAVLRQQTTSMQQQELRQSPTSPSSLRGASRLLSRTHYKRLVEQTPGRYQPSAKCARQALNSIEAIMRSAGSDDPALLRWLRDIRFEPELEPVSLQARSCAIDEHTANALSIRYSHESIQKARLESVQIIDFVDTLIDALPINQTSLNKFYVDFIELYMKLTRYTGEKTTTTQQTIQSHHQLNANANPLTITYTTPRKSSAVARTLRPLDKLIVQIRNLCLACANELCQHQDQQDGSPIDNGLLESQLRKLKELFGRQTSDSSIRPVRPFESSHYQLPLKWALLALWELTRDDSYICRALTDRTSFGAQILHQDDRVPLCNPLAMSSQSQSPSKRLDYSTKYECPPAELGEKEGTFSTTSGSLCHSDYQRLCDITSRKHNLAAPTAGALKSALRSKEPVKEASTIELLIEIIISQPNKHERLDMLNHIHTSAYNSQEQQLIKLEEWDQSVSAAIYTNNQYKVAALRILNQLCVNEQAVKTILKCFSTPPPSAGQSQPENKIIRSIFECYQTSQEHIYQNEPMFETVLANRRSANQQGRLPVKRRDHQDNYSDYSDYGSRKGPVSSSTGAGTTEFEQENEANKSEELNHRQELESEDAVVREAIALLVQLTAPFHRSNQGLDFYTLIGRFSIESLVKYLTSIVKSSSNKEMLLLSMSALANISFITTEPMKMFATTRAILDMFRSSKMRSKDLELRDQAVTVLANMADKNLLDIISNGGLTFLLSCLESCPTRMANYRQKLVVEDENFHDSNDIEMIDEPEELSGFNKLQSNIENRPRRDRKPIDFGEMFVDVLDCLCEQSSTSAGRLCSSRLNQAQLAAMERIHQKAAVAFARMSSDESTIKMVLDYGGIKRMIELCKFSQKRNYSDTVLIACIAALRKMAKHLERDIFKHYNALDLIELDLNRTLEIYGNQRNGEPIYVSEV